MKKIKIGLIIASCAISYALGAYLGQKTLKEVKIVEVERVQTRERAVTIIKELPDGTKTTTIDYLRDYTSKKDTFSKTTEKPVEKKWSVWAATGSRLDARPEPIYTLGIDKKILLGLSVGLYARTDSEFGVTLRYSF